MDDASSKPVSFLHPHPKVRIIRSRLHCFPFSVAETRQGLIRARILGGNTGRGDNLAFIDAHVRVAPHWLRTPGTLLCANPRRLVNFINFALDARKFSPMESWHGLGSSATISISLEQSWGGGSPSEDTSPITLGMFATSRTWWSQGEMDPGLLVWGGENVEISLRTWLCGGDIVVARDSYVAHAFRQRFPYKLDKEQVVRNYARVAAVWMDAPYRRKFYKASGIRMKKGQLPFDIGNITGAFTGLPLE